MNIRRGVLLVATFAALGQTPSRIVVTTRLVEVNVVVRGKDGPVEGLSKDDFVLYDRERRQNIAFFKATSLRRPQPLSQPLSPGEYSNRPVEGSDTPQRAIVIVLDSVNSYFSDLAWAKGEAQKALSQILPQDRVGVYVVGKQLTVLQDFTNDSTRLQDAIERYRIAVSAGSLDLDANVAQTEQQLHMIGNLSVVRVSGSAAAVSGELRSGNTQSAIREIAMHLAAVPGRKSVIWIASRFPGGVVSLTGENVAVYPVDASGLMAFTPMQAQYRTAQNSMVGPNQQSLQVKRVIAEMARNTGGMAFYNTNGLHQAIEKAMKDSEVSYTLGFYPDSAPVVMNPLRVTVSRKGVEVGYRQMYYDLPERLAPRAAPAEAIGAALASPLDATEILFNVQLERLAGGATRLAITVDPADISLSTNVSRRSGGIEIGLDQRRRDGLVLDRKINDMKLDLSQAQFEEFRKGPHRVTLDLQPDSAATEFRVVVCDRNSGRMGSLTLPNPIATIR